MSDDDRPEDEAAEDAARRRTSAQGAAADLARMGIDPRSLGLDAPGQSRPPATQPPAPPTPDPSAGGGRVVPIRPGMGGPPQPSPPPDPGPPPVGQDPSAPPDLVRVRTTAEALLARTETAKPAPRPVGRLLRALTLGLVTPDAAEASGNERDLVAAVRHRQTERRIVTFLAGKGGVGTTTVMSGVGAAFAALRDDRTVIVDLQPGAPSLARHHGLEQGVRATTLLRGGPDQAVPQTAAGLGVVDGGGWEQALQRRDVVGLLDRLGADYAFNLVDVGRDPGDASHAALARCDRAVVVTGLGASGTAALEVAMQRLSQVNPRTVASAVVVVVCQHAEGYRTAHREVSRQLGAVPARVVVVPPDPALRGGGSFDVGSLSAATRESMLEVGAAIALPEGR
ncbi:MAG: hypothetical protein Q7T56_13865 [Nocardioidaceae bacterium]|nr:hypothetical protein [Nocardioidaceae bacterium]